MATLRNFLTQALDRSAEAAQSAYDYVRGGLRGSAAPAAPEVAPEPKLSGAARQAVHGQEMKNMSANAFKVNPADARTFTGATNSALDAEYGAREGLRQSAKSPAWGQGMSPEARAYNASRATPFPSPEPAPAAATPKAGAARRLAGIAAKGLGAAGGLVTAADTAATDTDEYRRELGLPPTAAVGRGLRSIGVPENAAQLGDDLAVRYAGAMNRFTGGFLSAGQPTGIRQNAPTAAKQPGQPAAPAYEPQPPTVDVLDGQGGRARPEALVASSLVPAEGQGAFKRTTPGNEGSAVAINAPGRASDRPIVRAGVRQAAIPAIQPGVFGELAAMRGMRQRLDQDRYREGVGVRLRGQDIVREGQQTAAETTRRGQNLTAITAAARLNFDAGKDNRSNIESLIDSHADQAVPAVSSTLPGSKAQQDRSAQVKQYSSDLKTRIAYTLGDRRDGKRMEQLSPTEVNQLMVADAFRRGVTDKRGEVLQSFRDLFGNKRFDSRNLYSYMPVKAEPANDGGYVVSFANGNTAKADIVGGEFRLLGPNGPVDADLQQFIAPLIRQARGN